MLNSLHIKDYAIIDRLDVEFEDGLNIITGETGAGKSIIINALKLVLGARASADVIRVGAKKAVVEVIFASTPAAGAISTILRDASVEEDGKLIVRREVSESQSRAFINDTPVRLSVLKTVTGFLVDLHGQHEHQSLLHNENHIHVLDKLGDLSSEVLNFRNAFSNYREHQSELSEIQEQLSDQEQRKELNAFKLQEINSVEPVSGEDDKLFLELSRLQNSDRLLGETENAVGLLLDNDKSIVDLLGAVADSLSDLSALDGSLVEHTAELKSAQIAIQEVAAELRRYSDGVESSPEKLQEISDRLSQIEHVKRKYGGSLDAVLQLQADLESEQNDQTELLKRIEELKRTMRTVTLEVLDHAETLSLKRRAVGAKLEKQVVTKLAHLGMKHSSFSVEIREKSSTAASLMTENDKTVFLDETGMDRVEFYISANKGIPLKPLSKVASGGEVSRIMLALKSILANRSSIPVLVFDEIDVGISGKVAQQVGAAMYDLARTHQLIAITHLPQIAALGDAHFVVEKAQTADGVATSTRRLEVEERAAYVARLLGGEEQSETAIEHARTLLATSSSQN